MQLASKRSSWALFLLAVCIHPLTGDAACLDSKSWKQLTLQFLLLDQSKASVPYHAFLKDDDFAARVANELRDKFHRIEYGTAVYGGRPTMCLKPACFTVLSPMTEDRHMRQRNDDVYLDSMDEFPVWEPIAFAVSPPSTRLSWALNDSLTLKVILLRTDTDVLMTETKKNVFPQVLPLTGHGSIPSFDFWMESPYTVGQLLNKHEIALIPIVLKDRVKYWDNMLKRIAVNGKATELSYHNGLSDTWEISKQVAHRILELFDCSKPANTLLDSAVETDHMTSPTTKDRVVVTETKPTEAGTTQPITTKPEETVLTTAPGLTLEPTVPGLTPKPRVPEMTPKPTAPGLTHKPTVPELTPKPTVAGSTPEPTVTGSTTPQRVSTASKSTRFFTNLGVTLLVIVAALY